MTLEVSHGAFAGSAAEFCDFRQALARAAGYEVKVYEDAGWPVMLPSVLVLFPWSEDNWMGRWAKPPADPLVMLLVHSDEGGVLRYEHLGALVGRLVEIAGRSTYEFMPWVLARLDTFVAGLNLAIDSGDDVTFD